MLALGIQSTLLGFKGKCSSSAKLQGLVQPVYWRCFLFEILFREKG